MLGGVRLQIGGLVVCALVACAPCAFAEQDRERERPFRPMYAEDENLRLGNLWRAIDIAAAVMQAR